MKNKNLLLLLAGQLISQVGDKFHMIALSFWVLETTGSTARMGIVLAASLIPSLILGLFSGAIIDRYSRKRIIVITDLIRGIALLLFAVLFYQGSINFTWIIAIQILLSINAAFFDPAIPSIIPQIVSRDDLAAANSKHQFVNGFSTIFGAFFAGICIHNFGYVSIFFINAASFIFSASFETFIRIPKTIKNKKKSSLITEIIDGYTYIIMRKKLMILLLLVMLIHFFVGSNEIFMPLIANNSFSDGTKMLGFFQSAFGAGMVLMAAILSNYKMKNHEDVALFISVSIAGLIYLIIPHIGGTLHIQIIFYLLAFFFFGASIISAFISFKTLIQKNIDNDFSGRVFAMANTIGNGSIPLAMIVYGLLFEKFENSGVLFISGVILIVISGISYFLYNGEIKLKIKLFNNAIEKN